MIKWGTDFNDNYNYGATIDLLENDSIRFSSPFMPAGTSIKTWHSKTEFHSDRKSPMLPILMNGKGYGIQLEAEFDNDNAAQLVIEFFDANYERIDKKYFKELTGSFIYPEDAVTYNVQLVNKKHEFIIFKYLTIFSDSLKEQYDFEKNKSLSVLCLKVKHPYEGIKNKIVVLKNSKFITSLTVKTYMNYFFILDNQLEEDWLEATTYVCKELQSKEENSPIYIERGARFNRLDHKYKSLPYVLKVIIPRCKLTDLPTRSANKATILRDRAYVNQYVTDILQEIVSKKKKES